MCSFPHPKDICFHMDQFILSMLLLKISTITHNVDFIRFNQSFSRFMTRIHCILVLSVILALSLVLILH